jgi:hypothetical protein
VYSGVKDWKAGESNTKKSSELQKNEKLANSGTLASFGFFTMSVGISLFVRMVIPFSANKVMPFVGSNLLIFPANVKHLLVLPGTNAY